MLAERRIPYVSILTNPTTGGDVMPTIRAEFHRLRVLDERATALHRRHHAVEILLGQAGVEGQAQEGSGHAGGRSRCRQRR